MGLGKKKALVVEDNHSHLNLISSLLEEEFSYSVLKAADGDTGLEIVNREKDIILIITDIFMPRKEGIGFIRAVKGRHSQAKIVAITGAVNFESISETAKMFGADLILKKPLDVDDFIEKINSLIEV